MLCNVSWCRNDATNRVPVQDGPDDYMTYHFCDNHAHKTWVREETR